MDIKVGDIVTTVRNLNEDDIFAFPEPGYEDNIVVAEDTRGRVIEIEDNNDCGPSVLVEFLFPNPDFNEEWWVGHLIQDGVVVKVKE